MQARRVSVKERAEEMGVVRQQSKGSLLSKLFVIT